MNLKEIGDRKMRIGGFEWGNSGMLRKINIINVYLSIYLLIYYSLI